MKHIIAVTMLLIVALVIPQNAQGTGKKFAMSIKPGMYINAAHFGFSTGRLFTGFGLECLSVSAKSTYTYDSQSYASTTSATVFLPQLASKLFLKSEMPDANSVKPYLWLSLFYSIATASSVPNAQAATDIKDLLSGNFGGSLAFGSEYYFSPSFSIGGEFGMRFLFGGTKSTYTSYYTYTSKYNLGLGITYSTLGLNFYF